MNMLNKQNDMKSIIKAIENGENFNEKIGDFSFSARIINGKLYAVKQDESASYFKMKQYKTIDSFARALTRARA